MIEKIHEEHKVLIQRLQTLEQVASDAEAIVGMARTKGAFMPGRFEQKEGLPRLRESLEAIDTGLQAHFDREETGLLTAFEKHDGKMLASALRALLSEHEVLRGRLT